MIKLLANNDHSILQVMPPLTIVPEDVDIVFEAMDGALGAVGTELGLG